MRDLFESFRKRFTGRQPAPPESTPTARIKRKPVTSPPLTNASVYSVALEQQLALVRAATEPLIAGYFDQLYRDAMAKRPGLFTPPRDKLSAARTFAGEVTKTTPFFWTGAIADVVLAASMIIPDYTFTAESFPIADGFVWLEHPVTLPVEDKQWGLRRLTAWHWNVRAPNPRQQVFERPHADGHHKGEGPAWTCALWGYELVPQRPAGFPSFNAQIHFGWTLNEEAESPVQFRASTPEDQAFLKLVAASLSFLEQDLVVAPQGEAHRSVRRRLEKQAPQQEPFIKVIELRRRHYAERDAENDGGEGPDWKNRWIVSGHWRKQYYPSTEAHKPLYITPYVKGPENRPLKPPQSKLFVVKR